MSLEYLLCFALILLLLCVSTRFGLLRFVA